MPCYSRLTYLALAALATACNGKRSNPLLQRTAFGRRRTPTLAVSMHSPMRYFVLRCYVSAMPDKVWLEQAVARGFAPQSETVNWPRLAVKEKASILYRRYTHERTVASSGSGTTIQDRVQYEARFKFLSPWLKASGIMSFRREHEALRAEYGGTRR
jgi:hypothetical protein